MLNHPNYKVNLLMENEGPGTIKKPALLHEGTGFSDVAAPRTEHGCSVAVDLDIS